MKKLSIIIPTMQKDIGVLNMLIKELDEDSCIDEIIVIEHIRKDVLSRLLNISR